MDNIGEARKYFDKGFKHNDNYAYDKAIECFDRAIELDPNSIEAYYQRGRAYNSKGDYDKAVENSKMMEIFFKKRYFAPATENKNTNTNLEISCRSQYHADEVKLPVIIRQNNFFIRSLEETLLEDYLNDYFFPLSSLDRKNLKEFCKPDGTKLKGELEKELRDFLKPLGEWKPGFISGAITFFDFLGWKGLWRDESTQPLEIVADLIKEFREKLNKLSSETYGNSIGNGDMSTLISISDTIAIFSPKTTIILEDDLISLHACIARYILQESCKAQYPIRGAISYGEYSIINNVMIGPGIDECASWHEKGDWIGVHLSPSAQFKISANNFKLLKNIKENDKIPLKSGLPKIKYCVDWKIEQEDFNKLIEKVKAILPEIADKYINTYSFLFEPVEPEKKNLNCENYKAIEDSSKNSTKTR